MNNKSRTITVRLKNDICDYVDSNSGDSRSKFVEKAIEGYRSVDLMCAWVSIDAEECCKQLEELFVKGHLVVDKDGVLKVKE